MVRSFGSSRHLASLLKVAVAGVAVFAIAASWPTPGAMVLVKLVVLSVALVLAFVASGELDEEERALLRSIVKWRPASAGGAGGTP